MRELSIEEKAQRYDDAIKKAETLYKASEPMSGCNVLLETVFHELKESGDGQHRKWILEYLYDGLRKSDEQFKGQFKAAIAWLEKQGEQKSTDKVEPKFKNGQWIVWQNKCYKVNYNGCGYELIDQNGLSTSLEYVTVDENAHLWTIQDAKDGDVLQLGEVTAIFKSYISNGNCKCYCSVCNGDFEIPSQDGADNSYGCHNAIPATKEQRDTLMKAMTDAGCTFDFKKKESKKKQLLLSDVFDLELELEKTKEMNSTKWSEEDDYNLQCCIAKAFYDIQNGNVGRNNELISWLKSIKDRLQPQNHWKPSDEQMEALFVLLPTVCNSNPAFSLYNDLKKLKGE